MGDLSSTHPKSPILTLRAFLRAHWGEIQIAEEWFGKTRKTFNRWLADDPRKFLTILPELCAATDTPPSVVMDMILQTTNEVDYVKRIKGVQGDLDSPANHQPPLLDSH
jgi:hypothetical protein